MNFRNFSFFFYRISNFKQHRSFTKIKLTNIPNPFPELNITICGASSKIGKVSAMLLKRENLFKNIVLWDEHNDMTEIVNNDLNYMKTNTNFRIFCGRKGLVEAVSDSRIIYICENIQTIPGFTPLDLFKNNANAVRQIVLYVSEFNPTAMIVICSPPVTSLVPMAYEEMLKNDCDAGKQIFGIASNYFGAVNSVARSLSPNVVFEQKYSVYGGCDKITCIPISPKMDNERVLSVPEFSNQTDVKKIPDIKKFLKSFQNAEEDVLKMKVEETNIDGCYMSLAAACAQFNVRLAKALSGVKNITDYAYVKQKNPKNFNQRYLTCKVSLNEEGLESCHLPKLTPAEEANMKSIEKQLNSYIHAGEVYITGREQVPEHRRKIIKPKKEPDPEPAKKKEVKVDEFCKPRPKLKSLLIKNE